MHVFGCVCYVLNDRDHLAKFHSKSHKGLLLGYSSNSRVYINFNLRTRAIVEYVNVTFDEFSDMYNMTIRDNVEDMIELSFKEH